MAVTNYYTVDGHILGEATSGVRTDYLTDALGSVTATVDSGSTVVNTYRYKPYGGLLAKTGVGADPKFLWTGDTGSRKTGLAFSDQYNTARHYGARQAQWTSVDPLLDRLSRTFTIVVWGNIPISLYTYGAGAPTVNLDKSGLQVLLGSLPQIVRPLFRLPPGWHIEEGGVGSGPLPRPWPSPFEISPSLEACRDIDRQNEENYDNYCKKLHDRYSEFCHFQIGPCNHQLDEVSNWFRSKLWCGCCAGRRLFNANCLPWLKLKGWGSHIDQERDACDQCMNCKVILKDDPNDFSEDVIGYDDFPEMLPYPSPISYTMA